MTATAASTLETARVKRARQLAGFVVVVPALAFVGAIVLCARGMTPSLVDVAMLAVGTLGTMAGVEIGYHRYFTHRAFEARPWLVWLLGALGSSALLGPVIWWAAIHRRHHAYADREGDPHSPNWPHTGVRGLWHGHAGWLFDTAATAMSLPAGKMRDLWSSPAAVGTQRLYVLWAVLGLALPIAAGAIANGVRGALTGALWGGFVRIFVVSHFVWAINSLGHRVGAAATTSHAGRATNNIALVLPTLGGGFHANHHDAPRAYSTGVARWQIDPSALLLRVLACVGVITELRTRRSSE
jgi:stearoyl-CoA desaturase (delta-9 desaturase)